MSTRTIRNRLLGPRSGMTLAALTGVGLLLAAAASPARAQGEPSLPGSDSSSVEGTPAGVPVSPALDEVGGSGPFGQPVRAPRPAASTSRASQDIPDLALASPKPTGGFGPSGLAHAGLVRRKSYGSLHPVRAFVSSPAGGWAVHHVASRACAPGATGGDALLGDLDLLYSQMRSPGFLPAAKEFPTGSPVAARVERVRGVHGDSVLAVLAIETSTDDFRVGLAEGFARIVRDRYVGTLGLRLVDAEEARRRNAWFRKVGKGLRVVRSRVGGGPDDPPVDEKFVRAYLGAEAALEVAYRAAALRRHALLSGDAAVWSYPTGRVGRERTADAVVAVFDRLLTARASKALPRQLAHDPVLGDRGSALLMVVLVALIFAGTGWVLAEGAEVPPLPEVELEEPADAPSTEA